MFPEDLPPHQPRPSGSPLALAGIRVLDFSRVLAGPWCGQNLADLGADVIKIEEPQGDMARVVPPVVAGNESALYLCTNRNKRSIALDLNNPGAKEIILELLAKSDVLIENFTSRVMGGFGLDYDSIKDRFPRLIYCSISSYGREGSMANAPGYDPVVAAEAGHIYLNGGGDARPAVSSLPVVDLAAAMNATVAILAALYAREKLGCGQYVQTALYDSAIASLSYKGHEAMLTGKPPFIVGYRAPFPPGGELITSDGSIWISPTSDKMVRRMMIEALERPDLADDPRFNSIQARFVNADAFVAEVSKVIVTRSSEDWDARMKATGVPCGIVRTVAQALTAPITRERGLLSAIDHPLIGSIPNVASPIRMSGTPIADPVAPPLVGQHSAEVLEDVLGYTPDFVEQLAQRGIILTSPPKTART